MKEKELRLAFICYGGISLAVYMHGVTKEVLKVARASRSLHFPPAAAAPANGDAADVGHERETDTEEVYADLLRAVGAKLDLRIIVDTLAGASAGGINAVILGRALAHDLSLDPLEELWLRNADIGALLSKESRPKPWSKFALRPVVWALHHFSGATRDPEIAQKLSLFIRSRWFRPPFDGPAFLALLVDGMSRMAAARSVASSLLPTGQHLDLYVTVTDFYGYVRSVPINSPPVVQEREHNHLLKFSYRRTLNGGERSDFDADNVVGLAFAARATSSFPGAFPPAQLREVDRLLANKNLSWPHREAFLAGNFRSYQASGHDPARTSFVDGSVVNNKPFAAAVASIRRRASYRKVDRRIVYIDPAPEQPPPPPDGRVPGFWRTLIASLSDIPRNEPIYDELAWIARFNERAKRIRTLLDSTRPEITRLVQKAALGQWHGPSSVAEIHEWRETANLLAAKEAKYPYETYARLKLHGVLDNLARWLFDAHPTEARSPGRETIAEMLGEWAFSRGIIPPPGPLPMPERLAEIEAMPAWVRFLFSFDVEFRRRRLEFVIRGLNRLYGQLGRKDVSTTEVSRLNALKRRLYDALEHFKRFDTGDFIQAETRRLIQATLHGCSFSGGSSQPALDEARLANLDDLTRDIAAAIDLSSANEQVDRIFQTVLEEDWPASLRDELLLHYIGFAFWDVVTFLTVDWQDVAELDEIRVDRISPEDAELCKGMGAGALGGREIQHFGAFFSRRHRENDYLWGRLNAAERLIDIVLSAARIEGVSDGIDAAAFKRRAFEAILAAEDAKLPKLTDRIVDIRTKLATCGERL
jgi:patatin-related protein